MRRVNETRCHLRVAMHPCSLAVETKPQCVITFQCLVTNQCNQFRETQDTKMSTSRKSSILTNRKLSVDFSRKLSAISCASDVSCISQRFGMEQGHLKNIVQDILEMDLNDEWEVGDGGSILKYNMLGMDLDYIEEYI